MPIKPSCFNPMSQVMIDYFVTSLVILLVGIAFNIYPPSKLHSKYGYRTRLALKSKENWELAQQLSKKYLLITGVLSVLVSFALFRYGDGNTPRLLSVILPILFLACCVYRIEHRLG